MALVSRICGIADFRIALHIDHVQILHNLTFVSLRIDGFSYSMLTTVVPITTIVNGTHRERLARYSR